MMTTQYGIPNLPLSSWGTRQYIPTYLPRYLQIITKKKHDFTKVAQQLMFHLKGYDKCTWQP